MKKIMGTLFIMLFLLPMQSNAAGEYTIIEINDAMSIIALPGVYNPPGTHVNGTPTDAIQFFLSNNTIVKKWVVTSHSSSWVAGTRKEFTNSAGFNSFGLTCNTNYTNEFYDQDNNLIAFMKITVTGLEKPSCNSGGEGDQDGEGKCDTCGIFDCPGWSQYMGKLDDIKAAIPPPPNWSQVSQTFSDAIVPRLVNETSVMLGNLLGTAPAPPAPAPDLPSLQDGGFKQREPMMPNVPAIGDVNKNDIQYGGPKIPVEEDPTGGFKLNVDPVVGLPDVVPGGDPGPYKRDPVMPPAEYPGAPKEPQIDTGGAPKPIDGGGTPPTPTDAAPTPPKPNDSGVTAPKPGDNIGAPPTPNDGVNLPNKEHYMPWPGGG